MLLVLVAGLFAVVAPTWMICAIGLGAFEDETALQWAVRIVGLAVAGLALYLMFFRN